MAEALEVKSDETQSGSQKSNGEKGGARPQRPESSGPGPVERGTGWLSERWNRMRQFIRDVRVEARQVTWPTRSDVQSTTVVVLATVAFFAIYFFMVDFGVGSLVQWILHQFRK
jgi:preprotein translocase subunit SecE